MATTPPTAGLINSLDPNNPIDADKVYGADNWFRFVQEVLQTNQFPISEDGNSNGWDLALTVKASEVNSLLGITGVVEDRLNALEADAATLPSGTKMVFYQDAAPTGWVIDETVDEHSVRLTKGSVATGEPGGTIGGTYDFSAVFDSDMAEDATPGVGGHSVTDGQMPSHGHGGGGHVHSLNVVSNAGNVNLASAVTFGGTAGGGNMGFNTFSTSNNNLMGQPTTTVINVNGNDEPHSHTLTLRPKWAACIVATKS